MSRVSVSASSSRCSRISAASRSSTSLRAPGVCRDQRPSANAARALATARSTSSAPPRATSASRRPGRRIDRRGRCSAKASACSSSPASSGDCGAGDEGNGRSMLQLPASGNPNPIGLRIIRSQAADYASLSEAGVGPLVARPQERTPDVSRESRGPRRRRRPGRRGHERAPEPERHPAPRPRARPHRRALAHRALGLARRQRPGVARPLPGPGVRRRPRRLRPQGGGRRLFRRLRREDRRPDPLRRRGDARRAQRRPARLSRRDLGGRDRGASTSSPPPVPSSARCSRGSSPRTRASPRCIPPPTATPTSFPAGAVLVVGAGASGAQIAEELLRAGRRVYISVGPHDRPPRRYRGRDNVWWLGVLNKWDAEAAADHRARHLRGQRRLWRRDRRLPPPRGAGHDAPRPGRVVRRRRDDLRAGARGQPRDRRRQLPLGARRGRRLGRAQRPRPPGGAGGARHAARSRTA